MILSHYDQVAGLRGAPVVSLRSKGARGNGVGDQSAWDAAKAALAASGGGTLLVDPGVYVGRFGVDADNIHVRGCGRGASTLKVPDGTNVTAQVLTIGADHCSVRDLTIDGNRDNQSAQANPVITHRESDGIGIYGSNNLVSDVRIIKPRSHGIIVWDEATATQATNAGAQGANVNKTAGVREYNLIRNVTVEDNGMGTTGAGGTENSRAAFDCATSANARRNMYLGCRVKGGTWTGQGFTFHGGFYNQVIGGHVELLSGYGVSMHTGAVGNIITGLTLLADSPLVVFLHTNNSIGGNVSNCNFRPLNDTGSNGGQAFAWMDASGSSKLKVGHCGFYSRYGAASFARFLGGTHDVLFSLNEQTALGGGLISVALYTTSFTSSKVQFFAHRDSGVDLKTRTTGGTLTGTIDHLQYLGAGA
jgi:hypothetical protein